MRTSNAQRGDATQTTEPMKTTFSKFPTANLSIDATPDEIGFFEAIAIAGLECTYVRIPAATQRRHFGNVPFGKLAVRVNGNACTTIKAMDYGRDFDTQSAWWSMADKAWRACYDDRILEKFPTA